MSVLVCKFTFKLTDQFVFRDGRVGFARVGETGFKTTYLVRNIERVNDYCPTLGYRYKASLSPIITNVAL
jgi:hypothetical protein